MPEMNGWRCLTELKADALLKEISVVMYSATVTKTDQQRATELGAIGIYKKPERYEELKHLLQTIISQQ